MANFKCPHSVRLSKAARLCLTFLLCIAMQPARNSAAVDPRADEKNSVAIENTKPSEKKKTGSQATPTEKRPNRRSIDPEMERKVLEMVEQHLPDVKILLNQLRAKNQTQYGSAIRTLAKSAKRLETAKKRSEEIFELEVEVVKAQSSINLLVAKLRIRNNAKDRKALRNATTENYQAGLARDKHEFALWQERLKKMQKQVNAIEQRIADKESNATKQIDSSFKANLRKAGIKD